MRRLRWRLFWAWVGRWWLPFHTWLQGWQTLIAALAAFGTLFWGSYLSRVDTARAGRERCEALEQGLEIEVDLMHTEANHLIPLIIPKFSTPNVRHEFFPEPIDESIHAQEQELSLLDGPSQDIVLRSEFFYQSMRLTFTGVEKPQEFGPGATSDGLNDPRPFIGLARTVASLTAAADRTLRESHECTRRNHASLF